VARGALLERVKLLEENIRYRELQMVIAVGAGLDVPTMAKAGRLGARAIVVDGSSRGWDGETDPEAALASLREAVTAAMKTV
jgi:hypothetical protein